MLKELKSFLLRGNVADLAVGVIIGAAFGKIVASLVDAMIMPVLGALLGGINVSALFLQIGSVKIAYGAFLQAVVDFVLVGSALFLILKLAAPKKADPEPAPPSSTDSLLMEIRDLLKK
jgi:large conductance mechanosensitive channel